MCDDEYAIDLTTAAARDLKALKNNRTVLESIDRTILALGLNPRPNGVEKLDGKLHRVRDGEFRVLYEIDDESRNVLVTRVRNRKDVYKN